MNLAGWDGMGGGKYTLLDEAKMLVILYLHGKNSRCCATWLTTYDYLVGVFRVTCSQTGTEQKGS